jgi:asparagine synthase (glutamine-hydrolysing)
VCGILGMNLVDKSLARDAADLFSYRGPDSTGIFADKNVTLAFKRLAIIDLDPRSDQPMHDSEHLVSIVFNGEIYNYQELKKVLSSEFDFSTTSDTEVLLYAYKKWGVGLTHFIKGMFAFCIYDRKKRKLFLFRDFSGIKPLYYFSHDGIFLFASELKGILHLLDKMNIPIRLNRDALPLYYSLGYIPSPMSLYKRVFKVPARSYIEYDLDSHSLQVHPYEVNAVKSNGLEQFSALLEQKTLDHLIADVPVGLFFSGGTDSSVIASILQKHHIPLENFSIRMNHKQEDEAFFTKISNYLGISSHVYQFGIGEFDEVYSEVMNRFDEPIADGSLFPTYYISKQAAKRVKVVLSGEGGDEYFYGYNRHRVLYALRHYTDYNMTLLDRVYFFLPQHPFKTPLFSFLFRLFRQPISYYLTENGIGKDVVSWEMTKQEMRRKRIRPLDIDKLLYLENDLLRKTDFATSYNSLEGRVPLLDVDVIDNTQQFEDQKLHKGHLKYILKKILSGYLPEALVFRKKSGFGVNLKEKFALSIYLRKDFFAAVDYLSDRNMLPEGFRVSRKSWYIRTYPHLCYSMIVLYHCLKHAKISSN